MVNYCCVLSCKRNSKTNKQLTYYSLPKSRERQIQWLKAARRQDLMRKDPERLSLSYRFCSRHFQVTCIKNKNLIHNAIPTLHLPGDKDDIDDSPPPPPIHEGVVCDNCKEEIKGFRYKCVTCLDYDLCMKCEMREIHPEHFMLRISNPVKFKIADNLIDKWRRFFKAEHITVSQSNFKGNNSDSDTDDNEPIVKYAKQTDNLLPNHIKDKIREEVYRVVRKNKIEKVLHARVRAEDHTQDRILDDNYFKEPLIIGVNEPFTSTKHLERNNDCIKNKNKNESTVIVKKNVTKAKEDITEERTSEENYSVKPLSSGISKTLTNIKHVKRKKGYNCKQPIKRTILEEDKTEERSLDNKNFEKPNHISHGVDKAYSNIKYAKRKNIDYI